MRKSALALTSVGIGAGVLYAIGRGRSKRRRSESTKLNAQVAGLGKSETDTGVTERQAEKESSVKASSMAPQNDVESNLTGSENFELDDRGTNQEDALQLLNKIKAEVFQSSDEKLALALGRPVEEINAWAAGEQTIDSDVLMKARALALERGINT
jgi:hypothetical protein